MVSIILVILLVSVYVNLQNQINALTNEKNMLEDQVETLHKQVSTLNSTYISYVSAHTYNNTEYASLQSAYDNYVNTHYYSDSQYNTLINEIDSLKAAKIIFVNLSVQDTRTWYGTPYLHFSGEICNVGTNTAYNCKIHVVAYQGSVIAIDTYIVLGTIEGESWQSIDENVYYSGSAITSWTATPEWT